MIDLEQKKADLVKFSATIENIADALQIDELKKQSKDLEQKQNVDGFWDNMQEAQRISKQLKHINNKISAVEKLRCSIEDFAVMVELCIEAQDERESVALSEDMKKLDNDIEQLRIETLFRGKYDANNAILTLHAGAGGTEAQDWCSMLFRMYTRYIERKGFSYKILDQLDGDEAGIKSITFLVDGENAYGYLKAEKGVHRLVRISPFDSNSRRHTSFASLEVMPEIEDEAEIKINSDDLKVDTFRSSGAGGQHVNKTESAIRITHLPSGIVVQCQNERSQIQNREQAMKMLMSKLIEKHEREQLEHEQSLKGDLKKIEWGSQIRSYVFCPYTMVKDHRTGFETGNIDAVMDGDIEGFITEYLKRA